MTWYPKKKVVVPVDFSAESIAAIDAALPLVDQPSNLLVVHVLPVLVDYEGGMLFSNVDDESRARHTLQALKEQLVDPKYAGIQFSVVFGDAGHGIANFAEEHGAELIVLPSHGRTGLTRLLIGSTAERVVRLAHCPVLVLKAAVPKTDSA